MRLFVTLFLLYSGSASAVSGHSCVKILDSNTINKRVSDASLIAYGDQIQKFTENRLEPDSTSKHTFKTKMTLWRFGLPVKAEMRVQLLEDNTARITITTLSRTFSALQRTKKALEKTLTVFGHPLDYKGFNKPVEIDSDHDTEVLTVYVKSNGLSEKKSDMISYFVKTFMGVKAEPQRQYWAMETSVHPDDAGVSYTPSHMENHQPFDVEDTKDFKAPFYAKPYNIPESAKRLLQMTDSFKMYLDSDRWIIEGLFKDPEGKTKTLMLKALAGEKRFAVETKTPYQTPKTIRPEENLSYEITEMTHYSIFNEADENGLMKSYIPIELLPDFLEHLAQNNFKLQVPAKPYGVYSPPPKPSITDFGNDF